MSCWRVSVFDHREKHEYNHKSGPRSAGGRTVGGMRERLSAGLRASEFRVDRDMFRGSMCFRGNAMGKRGSGETWHRHSNSCANQPNRKLILRRTPGSDGLKRMRSLVSTEDRPNLQIRHVALFKIRFPHWHPYAPLTQSIAVPSGRALILPRDPTG